MAGSRPSPPASQLPTPPPFLPNSLPLPPLPAPGCWLRCCLLMVCTLWVTSLVMAPLPVGAISTQACPSISKPQFPAAEGPLPRVSWASRTCSACQLHGCQAQNVSTASQPLFSSHLPYQLIIKTCVMCYQDVSPLTLTSLPQGCWDLVQLHTTKNLPTTKLNMSVPSLT